MVSLQLLEFDTISQMCNMFYIITMVNIVQ